MQWREIRKSGEYLPFVPKIWRKEQSLPKWFRSANSCWTSTEEEFRRFCDDCAEIFALFDDDGKLTACVYVEKSEKPEILTIHLSIIEKIKPSVFIAEAGRLRNYLLRRGAHIIRGWILKKNFALCKILLSIGFLETSLSFRYGSSHGQVLKWRLYQLTRG